ncbi:MAG: pullulanase-type alpha-1,6-glucosidase, partial [Anaerolineae bacterium]|nr:pullulanase-type alpha-1,6-glucosidase [Anaerolineae bacterium]
SVTFYYNSATNEVWEEVASAVPDEDLVAEPAQSPLQDEVFYFLLTDRFANGDPSNDEGAFPGGTLAQTGFLPTDKSFYHGGDLAGLRGKLDYLAGLGVTSLWITPVFKNKPTQPDSTTPFGIGGAYHGYWILDYENTDPHLGTNAELQAFIDEAHEAGMKVFFDIVVNHTADVISYAEGQFTYRNKADYPYRDADGNVFDDRDYVGGDTFPALDPEISFPYTPIFPNPGDATAKNPAWLNNPIYYHNRGDSTFAGESSTYGDFFGLDDLFTEHPDVVNGYIAIFKHLIDTFDIDGFRLDTVKHVNIELWQQLVPEVLEYARSQGKEDFALFGEVFDGDVNVLSLYTTAGKLPSVLDFGLHGASVNFAVNAAATNSLANFFAQDDYYTDADSNAYGLGNFVSNHDGFIERLGGRLRQAYPGASDAELVARMNLAYGLIFFARGFPVIYYGDEQGFVGIGSDKLAREDMLPSQVPDYMHNDLIGTDATPADDNFDPTHPIYRQLADYASVYRNHVALRRGAQITRYSRNGPGIFAFSRVHREEKVEYVVALNNATTAQQATFDTFTPNATWTAVFPAGKAALRSGPTGLITVDVPALGVVIYRADRPIPASDAAPDVTFVSPAPGAGLSGRSEIRVNLSTDQMAEVTFLVKVAGGGWELIGVDTNPPYRVFYDVSGLPAGTSLTFRAIANDLNGHLKGASVSAVVAAPAPPAGPKYAIIHYVRADGDYGDHTTGNYNDFWGLHLWGDIEETIEWTSPKPFLGETDYGRFAWVKLAPGATNVGFIVHRGDIKDGTNADRFFDPSQTPEIWLVGGDATTYTSQAAAQGYVTIHYRRPNGDYGDYSSDDYNDFWGLHLWGDAIDPSEATSWTNPRKPDGQDDYGVYFKIRLQDVNQPVNFIVHRGDVKDPPNSPDRSFNPTETASIWLLQDDVKVYNQRGAALNVATLHYHRPAGDYGDPNSPDFNDFWGLHTWGGAVDPGWTTPRRPTRRDLFGLVFDVPLFEGATQIGYIFHRGNEKDPGPDQFLVFADKGYEVWQLQGADPEDPYILPVPRAGRGSAGNIREQRAYWVTADTIAWSLADSSAYSYWLCYAAEGGLEATLEGIVGGDCISLTRDSAGLPAPVRQKFPHLANLPALKISPDDLDLVPEILKGQFAVSALNAEGVSQGATGLQIPGVLDDLYTYEGDLGVTFDAAGVPTIRLWAPTAQSVTFHLFADSNPATASTTFPMTWDADTGVWSITGQPSWKGRYYLYEVEVFVPSTGRVERNLVTDPYSFSLAMNSTRSQIVDLNDRALKPAGWDTLAKPKPVAPEQISIYEIHVRDFSVYDPGVPDALKGTYKAFTLPPTVSNGVRHLRALARAGLTHLHLLPVFDIATINEDKSTWQSPSFAELAAFPPDSTEQQARVEATRDVDPFNWGYDPWHYTVPEGSYATNPDGPTRIVEFREMVQALNGMGLRVVMDVVYNHTNAAGQSPKSVLDRIVPGYYHRLNDRGQVETSTCCPNTATEHNMMEKLMIDSVLTWAKQYKVDAFRFDLMGHHMKRNMLKLRQALDSLTLERDGVDGRSIYVYGEGWNFGEVANNARGENATQLNMAGTGIGTFSDRLRDAVRGGGPFDGGQDLVRRQGFANGLFYDPNALNSGSPAEKATLLLLADQIRVGLAGNLADYQFVDRNGNLVRGRDVDYNGQPAGYTQDPQENIIYISKHDNQTLYDINAYKAPVGTSMADRVRIQQVGFSIVALGQGVHFFHAGDDLLRSKSLDRDSYDSGDWFNRVDFTYQDNAWGSGLPVARVNQDNWPIMQPLLANPALKPQPAHLQLSTQLFREWLAIRSSSPLFSLPTAADIQARLAFHNTGPNQIPGLIVMSLSDLVEPDLDRRVEFIVVLFNANDEPQTFTEPATVGMNLVLHPVQRNGADPVVKTATFNPATGTFRVPARTTAVFVLPTPPTVPNTGRFPMVQDTFINGTRQTLNFGSAGTMWFGHRGWLRPVMRADLSAIPGDAAVDRAYLWVYVTEGRGFTNYAESTLDVSVHTVSTPWAESTATWLVPWTTAGGDFGPALQTIRADQNSVGKWMRFDVTNAVAAMVAGEAPNYGFLLTSEHLVTLQADPFGLVQTRYGLATRQYWDAGKAGYLEVQYRTYE